MPHYFGIRGDISPAEVETLERNINNILSRGLKLKLYVIVTQKKLHVHSWYSNKN